MIFDIQGFSAQLQSLRVARKLTQAQLAELSGLSAHYIGNLEQGIRAPSLIASFHLCSALGTTPDNLFESSISSEMRNGISVAVHEPTTLRDSADTLDDLLSDLLPPDNEKIPTLFGIPINQLQEALNTDKLHSSMDALSYADSEFKQDETI